MGREKAIFFERGMPTPSAGACHPTTPQLVFVKNSTSFIVQPFYYSSYQSGGVFARAELLKRPFPYSRSRTFSTFGLLEFLEKAS